MMEKRNFYSLERDNKLTKVNSSTLRIGEISVTCSSVLRVWVVGLTQFETHITNVCNAAFFHKYNIRRIRKFLNDDNTRTLVNAFVTSRGNSILYGLPASSLKKLQRVQNTAARLICNISRFDHTTPTMYKLHWLLVKFRIDFKVLLITYEALRGLVPEYITEIITIKHITVQSQIRF